MDERPESARFVYTEADSHPDSTQHIHVNIKKEVNIHESTTHLYFNINKELHVREETVTHVFGDSTVPTGSSYTPSNTNEDPTTQQRDEDTSDKRLVTVGRIIFNADDANKRTPAEKRKVTLKETTLSRCNRFGCFRQSPSKRVVVEVSKQPITYDMLERIHGPTSNKKLTVFDREPRLRDHELLSRTHRPRDLIPRQRSVGRGWRGKTLNLQSTQRDNELLSRTPRQRDLIPSQRSVERGQRSQDFHCHTTRRDHKLLSRTPRWRDHVPSQRRVEPRWCGEALNFPNISRDQELLWILAQRKAVTSRQKSAFELKWRSKALNCLTTPRNVFILNVYMVKHYLLQVKISSSNSTLHLNTLPWSTRSGEHLHENEFKELFEPLDIEVQHILHRRLDEFSPSRIVRFVLENCDEMPVIVSSDYTRMISTSTGQSLVDRFVYRNLCPGSQYCYHRNCNLTGTAVRLTSKFVPTGIYCSKHVRRFGSFDNVMLYNPLLVAFTPREDNVVFSALNIEEVFRARALFSLDFPIRLRREWTVICRKPQPVRLHDMTEESIFFQTAINTLDCANEHAQLTKHFREIDVLHSLTRCLFKAFLPCGMRHTYSIAETIKEDLPYRWECP